MRYDEIFERPIEEYSDDEIRQMALKLRANAKLTRGTKAKKETKTNGATKSKGSTKKDKIAEMLEQSITQAKLRNKDN
jgi:hypothetical protein